MKYDDHITPEKVTDHRRKVEKAELEEAANRRAAINKAEEKAAAIASKLSPAVEKLLLVWPILRSLVKEGTRTCFDRIAAHINADYICAGSFPAARLATIWKDHSNLKDTLKLRFNDVNIYHGTFGAGRMYRGKCT